MQKTVWMDPEDLDRVRLQEKMRDFRALLRQAREEARAFLSGASDPRKASRT